MIQLTAADYRLWPDVMFCLLTDSLALFFDSVKADAATHQQDNS